MGERFRELRKALDLTQTEFGERIGVSQSAIASYEAGTREPIQSVVKSICREFGVSESWLRDGEEPMFTDKSKNEQISAIVANILERENDDFRKRVITMLAALDEEEWRVLEKMAKKITEGR